MADEEEDHGGNLGYASSTTLSVEDNINIFQPPPPPPSPPSQPRFWRLFRDRQ